MGLLWTWLQFRRKYSGEMYIYLVSLYVWLLWFLCFVDPGQNQFSLKLYGDALLYTSINVDYVWLS